MDYNNLNNVNQLIQQSVAKHDMFTRVAVTNPHDAFDFERNGMTLTDSSGRLGVESTPMNVVVNNNVGAEVRVRESEEGLTIDLVRKQLINDIRSGGNGFANAFAGTYGLNRINR
jgi:hypothetical protein